jgi:hypothetical protein
MYRNSGCEVPWVLLLQIAQGCSSYSRTSLVESRSFRRRKNEVGALAHLVLGRVRDVRRHQQTELQPESYIDRLFPTPHHYAIGNHSRSVDELGNYDAQKLA